MFNGLVRKHAEKMLRWALGQLKGKEKGTAIADELMGGVLGREIDRADAKLVKAILEHAGASLAQVLASSRHTSAPVPPEGEACKACGKRSITYDGGGAWCTACGLAQINLP